MSFYLSLYICHHYQAAEKDHHPVELFPWYNNLTITTSTDELLQANQEHYHQLTRAPPGGFHPTYSHHRSTYKCEHHLKPTQHVTETYVTALEMKASSLFVLASIPPLSPISFVFLDQLVKHDTVVDFVCCFLIQLQAGQQQARQQQHGQ